MRTDFLTPGPTRVMGIVNVTPDSFSDGGDFFDPQAAIAHGRQLLAEGASILDVGGESTRPGATRPGTGEELRRVVEVIGTLAAEGAVVSVDTMRAEVAREAVRHGAAIVNDVSGGLTDPAMLSTVAELGVPYVLTHWRGSDGIMLADPHYDDVVDEVVDELQAGIARAEAAGIARDRLILDPGFGFAKTAEHNWELIGSIDSIQQLGLPVLLGVSRKAFLGALLADENGPRPPVGRDAATTAFSVTAGILGLWAVRTHAVRANVDVIAVADRMRA
ncbi:dihydropteroate synthase [Propionibacteriaceae bacterium Y1700]|uniref:dihydropteroate synthase n=1 Tax=Microlunatus sp. Y1700 TaxID=3418487 RepID=UPI003DA730CA